MRYPFCATDTYDSNDRLLGLATDDGAVTLASFSYTLDDTGNRTAIAYADGSKSAYEYDNAYRLTKETRTVAEDAVARWKFDESSGSSAADAAGAHTGTLNNFPGDDSQWVSGKLDNALVFDGYEDYVSVADAADLSFGNGTADSAFTISAWVHMNDATEFAVVSKGVLGTTGEYVFGVDADDKLYLELFDESASARLGRKSDSLLSKQGNWVHVAATYDGTGGENAEDGIALYVNGVDADTSDTSDTTKSGTYVAMEGDSASLHLGRYDTDYADGKLDDARIYPRALTAVEVVSLAINKPITYEIGYMYDAVGNRTRLTGTYARAYGAETDTRGLWHLDDGLDGFVVPFEAFSSDADTEILYHFEECDAVDDSSSNNFDGTPSGTPTYAQAGRFINAIELDGTDDYVWHGDETALEPGSGDFTVEVSIYRAQDSGADTIASKWDEENDDRAWKLYVNSSDQVCAEVSTSGTTATVTLTGTTALSDEAWYHVVLQRDSSDLTLWLEGTKEDSDTITGSVHDGEAAVMVGAHTDSGASVAGFFEGRIDELRISSTARYTKKLTEDSSGNDNDGELAGATISDDGRFDKGLSLDGSDDYVEVPDDGTLDVTGDFTVEAWVKPSSLTGLRVIVAKWDTSSQRSYRLYLDGGWPKIQLSTDGTAEYTLAATASVLADEWSHVTASRSGSTVKIFLNSAEQASGTYSSSLHSGSAKLRIGADAAGNYFAGGIDEVRVSSADKSATLGQAPVVYEYNARNQLTLETQGDTIRTYEYDSNGNVTKIEEEANSTPIGTEEMYYDALNRMTKYTGPRGTENFAYRGAKWHRRSQTAGGSTTKFLYDGDNVIGDFSGSSVAKMYVTPFLDQNLSITVPGSPEGVYYYSLDGLGSARTLTDSSGDRKNRYDYMPFGKLFKAASEAVAQRYAFTAREQAPVSPLIHTRARTYDPRTGRFTSRDPVPPTPQRTNTYVYARNNPVVLTDPYGGCAEAPPPIVFPGPYNMGEVITDEADPPGEYPCPERATIDHDEPDPTLFAEMAGYDLAVRPNEPKKVARFRKVICNCREQYWTWYCYYNDAGQKRYCVKKKKLGNVVQVANVAQGFFYNPWAPHTHPTSGAHHCKQICRE